MFRWLFFLLFVLGVSVAPMQAADADTVAAFHKAAQTGDVEKVRSMLAADPKLATSQDKFKFQPIHLLDIYPEAEVLNLLLANGADINAANDEGVTILHIIAEPNFVPALTGRGANIEALDMRGWTPQIMQANNQENGHDIVAALLAAGADPNAEGAKGETALSFARQTGKQPLVDLLTAKGARR